MRLLLLAPLAMLVGCSLLSPEDEITTPLYAGSVHVERVEGRTVTFAYATGLSGCATFAGAEAHTSGGSYVVVDVQGRVPKDAYCLAVERPFETRLRFSVPRPGRYTFHFPTGPRGGLDLDVEVP